MLITTSVDPTIGLWLLDAVSVIVKLTDNVNFMPTHHQSVLAW